MKRPIVAVTMCLIAIFLTVAVRGDDAEDVKAAYSRHILFSRTGQVEPFVDQHLPGHSAFGPTGGMLTRYDSPEEERISQSFEATGLYLSGHHSSSPGGQGLRRCGRRHWLSRGTHYFD